MSQPNKQRLKLWVEALRSGEFEQTRQTLARVDASTGKWGYCCLGVACEVAMANGLDIPTRVTPAQSRQYGDSVALMPSPVCDWFGLPTITDLMLPAAIEGDDDTVKMATELNDDYGWDFNQIADAIEAKFELGEEKTDGE